MSDKSGIQWTDATWNPITGCSKVSQGCKHCYALRDWARVAAPRAKPNAYTGRAFTDVRFHPERLDQPLRWRRPRRVFVNSMSDLFHEKVTDEAILQVFDVMRQCANGWTEQLGGEHGKLVAAHTFQILTKRPARMLDFCSRLRFAQNDDRGLYLARELPHNGFNPMRALRNIWLGVSVEDQATADERIPLLLQTPAAVRFVSYEPALGPVSVFSKMTGELLHESGDEFDPGAIDWLIVGGESGPGARPCHVAWIRSAVEQCKGAGVPCFVKQLGALPTSPQMFPTLQGWGTFSSGSGYWLQLNDRKGGDPAEWPEDLRVREMPQ